MNAKAAAATIATFVLTVPLAASAVQVGMSNGTTTTTVSVSPYRSMSSTSTIYGPGSISASVVTGASPQQAGATTAASGSGPASSGSNEQLNVTIIGGYSNSATTITGTSIQSGTTFSSSVFSNL